MTDPAAFGAGSFKSETNMESSNGGSVRAQALKEAAEICMREARILVCGRRRVRQADAHIADILAGVAKEILALEDKKSVKKILLGKEA